MNDSTRRLVEATHAAAAGSTTIWRAELIEAVVYALYDHVKFRVPGGADSEERDELGLVLNAVIAYADRARHQVVPPPDTHAQELIDHALDRACQERPSSSWVITVPLEVVAILPPDPGWAARRLPQPPGHPPHTRTYRGADVEAAQWDEPLVVFTDVATDTPPLCLNLNTGQVGSSRAEVGLG